MLKLGKAADIPERMACFTSKEISLRVGCHVLTAEQKPGKIAMFPFLSRPDSDIWDFQPH
ncbi:hypothetical protein SAMN05444359_110139 [Neolewinella agarilytica]|uniref:Uncharacterized protein n=1 Tax=Neolewinella agarilytica TaxID=478744 RepID=A0A1H9GDW2_9BACT|nr:hypothetical protein SAMN05444359_110139 [Neolewinella agarilytica]